MDRRIIIVNVIIHGFAAAHAATAAALAQTLVGDEAALSALTIAMIVGISRVYDRPFGVGEALSVLGLFVGFYLGTRGAVFLIKWMPGIGNAANAITTVIVTELIGWATYLIVKDGKDPRTMSKEEAKEVWKKAKSIREEMKEQQEKIKDTVSKMSQADKNNYEQLIKKMQNRDLPESEAKNIEKELEQLFQKYGL